jgi:hypothetical protein
MYGFTSMENSIQAMSYRELSKQRPIGWQSAATPMDQRMPTSTAQSMKFEYTTEP